MPDTQETRDLAVGANLKVDTHIQDCIRFREQIDKSFGRVNDGLTSLGEKVNNLQIKAALVLGGLIVIGKAIDYFLVWIHK